jgi:hypothetical protein
MATERRLTFSYERDTKNKYRFREDSEVPVMGTIYLTKDLFEDRPDGVEVIVRTV